MQDPTTKKTNPLTIVLSHNSKAASVLWFNMVVSCGKFVTFYFSAGDYMVGQKRLTTEERYDENS